MCGMCVVKCPTGAIQDLLHTKEQLEKGKTTLAAMEAKEAEFLDQYVGKAGGNFIVNKDNKNGLANEIDAISGATITTRAVTKGVNAAYITLLEIMDGGDINE